MRYKNSDDNRYRVQFMRSTEELMDQLTVKEFISYLEENAEFEDYTVEYIDKKCVKCRAYDLTEENSKLHKEFLVTEDGRVFYWRSLISKVELVDAEEEKQEVQEMVVDFREAKEVAKEVAKELTEKDSNWKWRVQVLKSEIRVWWGYLQYCDTEDSHFTIKMSDREDECGTDTDFMVARNERDEYMTGRIVGVDECWQDGDLNTCVAGLLRGIATIAHSRY
jgi:ssDNA-binding Zn-finger/Zn-ribbon topoisomerase 1